MIRIAVADPRCQEIAVGDQADDAILFVDDGQVADATDPHQASGTLQ